MSHYVFWAVALVLALGVYGVAVPRLMNAPSDAAVFAGIALALLFPAVVLWAYRRPNRPAR